MQKQQSIFLFMDSCTKYN